MAMNFRWLLLAGAFVLMSAPVPQRMRAFPGAEGFGAFTPGGRGGRTYIVTNLNDSGPGSFREAVTAAGPRTVVFAVGGIIDLESDIKVQEPYLTVAGQSAPGDGICLRGREFSIQTHDVIVRFLRSRPGPGAKAEVDAINVVGNSRNVILDHCSASWSVDEALSPSGNLADITVQWSIIAEGLNQSVHHKGPHGYGSLVRAAGGLTLHHNLWAHNNARNPRLGDNYGKPPFPRFDVRNNVMYDWGEICSGMTGDRLEVNYVANYIKPGPSSHKQRGIIVFTDTADARYYLDGNVVEGDAERTAKPMLLFDRMEFQGRRLVALMTTAFEVPVLPVETARQALESVLAHAGAMVPVRDAVDARIVSDVRKGTGHVIDSPDEVGGWPKYRGGEALPDSDHDGIPDAWEKRHKLNPRDASDAVKTDAGGYTWLEVYLNELAGKS